MKNVACTEPTSNFEMAADVGSMSRIAQGWRPHSATTHPACPAM